MSTGRWDHLPILTADEAMSQTVQDALNGTSGIDDAPETDGDRIRALRRSNLSIATIADETGHTENTVRRALRSGRGTGAVLPVTEQDVRAWRRMREAGMRTCEIAAQAGRAKQTVRRHLRRS